MFSFLFETPNINQQKLFFIQTFNFLFVGRLVWFPDKLYNGDSNPRPFLFYEYSSLATRQNCNLIIKTQKLGTPLAIFHNIMDPLPRIKKKFLSYPPTPGFWTLWHLRYPPTLRMKTFWLFRGQDVVIVFKIFFFVFEILAWAAKGLRWRWLKDLKVKQSVSSKELKLKLIVIIWSLPFKKFIAYFIKSSENNTMTNVVL